MVDAEVLCEDDYETFVQKVCFLLPTHKRLPVASEVRRMCVQSFRKSAEYWKSNDAPVSGYRFDAYLRIARLTEEKLRKWRISLVNSHATLINSHKNANNTCSTPIKGLYFTSNSQQLYADGELFFIGFFYSQLCNAEGKQTHLQTLFDLMLPSNQKIVILMILYIY